MVEPPSSPIDEHVVREFERAWAAGVPPRIEEVLPAAEAETFAGTLEELVMVELELRWRSGERPTLHDYLGRFPTLDEPEARARLAREEAWVRQRFGGPRALGRFALLGEHARGAMGVVWRAEDSDLGRHVAVKVLRGDREDAVLRRRFVSEARITAQLEHPGVVPVYEAGGLESDDPYYAMRLVNGRTLADAIGAFHQLAPADPARRVERLRLLEAFLAVSRTVAYAHARGVVHRDLKPANVVLGEYGETVVLDWGLARAAGEEPGAGSGGSAGPRVTHAGDVLGTPAFMSPEHAAGAPERIGAASDVWSLGAILFNLLTGDLPYAAGDAEALLRALEDTPPRAPRQVDASVPRALDAVVRRAMARDPARRYPTAAELAADMERFLADEPVLAWREPWWSRGARWARRHRGLAAGLGVALLAAVLLAAALGIAARRAALTEAERLDDLRAGASAAMLSARTEVEAERFVAAGALLRAAAGQVDDEPALAALAERVRTRLQAVEALVAFEVHAEAAEAAAFRRDAPAAARAAEDALLALGVFEHADWWAHLPELELQPTTRYRLRALAYRQIVLLAGLRTAAAEGAERELRCAEARDLLFLADSFRPARVVADLHDRCAPWPEDDAWRPHRPDVPRTAADHHFLAVGALALDPLSPMPGRPDPALCDRLDRAAAMDPDHVWTQLWRGRCAQLLGDNARAQRAFDHAVSLRPDDWLPYALRSAVLVDRGAAADDEGTRGELVRLGLVDVRRAVDLAPDEPLPHWLAASTLRRLPALHTDWLDAAARAVELEHGARAGPTSRRERWLRWAEGEASALEATGEAAYVGPLRDRLLERIAATRAEWGAATPAALPRATRRLAPGAVVDELPLLNGDFEVGLAGHWGRGQYDAHRPVWWNSRHCTSTATITHDERHGGLAALHIHNSTPLSPHAFGTTAQEIPIDPSATYEVRLWVRGRDVESTAVWLTVEPSWMTRVLIVPEGTYDWTRVTGRFQLDAEVAQFRVVSHAPGEVWLDDIEIRRVLD